MFIVDNLGKPKSAKEEQEIQQFHHGNSTMVTTTNILQDTVNNVNAVISEVPSAHL